MPNTAALFRQAQAALKQYFGYDQFHPTQATAIKSVLAGADTFVLMPTGGGKSICYQIPALVLPGTTIVVSPLIALMKDQVDGLRVNGVAAEYLNSSLELSEQSEVTKKLLDGNLQLLYVSAERLITPEFIQILKKITVNLFAVDEAHCISAWGHDFRPDYTKLSQLRHHFPHVPIIALTATADATTRRDILSQLELRSPRELVDSFDRPNISLTVLPGQNRIEKITEFLSDKPNQSGIIYCLTRNQTEQVAEKLRGLGLAAACYHAGMSSAERSRIQRSFVRDTTQIICATIAFGMGIDKSNVRWVIHYNIPKNIEGYYQEIGRAGRDSVPSQTLLLYTYADVEMIKKFAINTQQGAIQLAKLEQMKEYAEAVVCRRKILLQYFGETLSRNCGNCDICQNPFKTLNGTTITREILTQIAQAPHGRVAAKQLVAELSNSSQKVSFASWYFYLAQLKNQGLLAVDHLHNQQLFVTPKGTDAVRQNKTTRLVLLETFIARQESVPKTTKRRSKSSKKTPASTYAPNPLFEKLRTLRLELAQKSSLAAYMVFSDATLLEMSAVKPRNKAEMLAISGVGEVKWRRYGEAFLEVIGEANTS